ncbi:ABC transporter ATP-binding protein [Oceanihabitans sp. IOP_32]|uniref:ABC transporter ATP-binding protein n=1 Tax=Oceanihabitans sp. IOP_32 TaxID=2529032 RepID=UPI00129324A1|nr:ABC transporter ATP-binding protein [Oceanihabitans sp. IOP_32]QFZ54488.1 ABC transporter ATP-binding protein [Oceanihabitans sp. IOP_32]
MTNINNIAPLLEVNALSKSYASHDYVIDEVNLRLEQGKVMALVGESGSGKTTLVRLIAGLETPDSGSISIGGQCVTSNETFIPPESRKVGMVFQDYALFPHLTVIQNIVYGCKDIEKKDLKALLEMVGLLGFEQRYPHQLSGGQQQRVALARALAPRPRLLILDEPFSNLDVGLKLQLRSEIFKIIQQLGITAIFVTHDTQDAIMIADEIVVLKKGQIVQQGNASFLFNCPNSLYVAALFGSVVPLNLEDLKYFNFTGKLDEKYAIRMEQFQVNAHSAFKAEITILKSLFFGQHYLNTCKLPNGKLISFTSAQELRGNLQLGFELEAILVFRNLRT